MYIPVPPPVLLFPCSHTGRLMFLKYSRQAPAPGPLHLIFPLPVTFQVSSIFFHFFVALAQLLPSLSEIPSFTMQYKVGVPYEPQSPFTLTSVFLTPTCCSSISHIWQTWPMNLRLLSHVLEDLVLCLLCDPFPVFFCFFFYYGTKYGLRLLGLFFFFFAYEYPVILAPLVEKTALTLIYIVSKINYLLMCGFVSGFCLYFYPSPVLHYLDCCSFVLCSMS